MSVVHELRIAHGKAGRTPGPNGGAAAGNRFNGTSIALFGLFGCGNLGNDASLESMLSCLRENRLDAALLCICKDTAVISDTFGIRTVPLRREKSMVAGWFSNLTLLKIFHRSADFIHALWIMRGVGVLIVPGTGILDDFGDRPTGMPLDIYKWCIAARLMGTRIALVSIGAGPIGGRFSRWLMTNAARMADYRSYRDTGSREFLEKVGVDTSNDALYPDLAFKLPVPPAVEEASAGPLTVGVGIMNYRGWYGFQERGQAVFEAYTVKMVKFVKFLLDGGCNVRLLIGDKDDVSAVKALLLGLGDIDGERLAWEPVHSIHDVIRQVARTDLVVATRFHNIVAALMAGKPVISLGYAPKNALLLEEMGLGEYCQDVDSFDLGLLVDQFEKLLAGREEHARIIDCKVAKFRNSLKLQDDYLLSTVLSGPRND